MGRVPDVGKQNNKAQSSELLLSRCGRNEETHLTQGGGSHIQVRGDNVEELMGLSGGSRLLRVT